MIPFEMEIFKAGTQTDSSGVTKTFTEADLDSIAAAYDPKLHEAPIVVGHVKQNSPAYGWVRGLRRIGDRLWAAAEALPEFVELVKEQLYKKRSASFYTNFQGKGLYLNHVAFLGGNPPAVKGLEDIAFSGSAETSEYESGENTITINTEEKDMALEERLSEFMETLRELVAKVTGKAGDQKQEFTEEQKQALVQAEAKKLLDAAKTEFAQELDRERKEKEKLQRDSRKKEITDFCEKLKKEGKLLPAWEALGLTEFMLSLDGAEVLEFAQGGEKISRAAFMQKLLSELPKVVEFSEKTGRDKTGTGNSAAEKLDALVSQKMKDHKDLSYTMAFSEVQREHPELATQYQEELQG